ncbi:MAG: 23S rRNA (adenine(2503)-C(2))-methyltransferase RlmN [Deltaproteobacteria bacterium]|jgi:23S rRNA (adenine2503-C2)-methyltransferase|nr:23S rRNA (adenine(2503)-C(2))-methyltransferase RlmN [Deltaproteobacteria bacterium]
MDPSLAVKAETPRTSEAPPKTALLDLTIEELKNFVSALGERPYRAEQLAAWLHRRKAKDFHAMTDVSLASRRLFLERSEISPRAGILKKTLSSGGTLKLLNLLPDGEKVESVLIPDGSRLTLCLSSQTGCALGCAFCRTATLGPGRNLSQGELLTQLDEAEESSARKATSLVFMGMGEPLLNRANLEKALSIIVNPKYKAFAQKDVTVSTVGIIPELLRFGASFPKIPLAVSLNSADQSLREELMPAARAYPLKDLKEALLNYPLPKNRRFTVAYVLLKGVNDGPRDLKALSRYLTGLRVKINLIAFNPWPGAPFEAPEAERVEEFRRGLLAKNFTALVRKSRGSSVGAACGQLRAEEL